MKHTTKKKSGKKYFSSTRKMQHRKTRRRVQRGGHDVMEFGQIIGKYDPTSGAITYVNGNIYIGELDELFQKNGQGRMTYDNGRVYEGEWVDDIRTGRGILSSPELGNIYEGEWRNGWFNGHGIYRYPDGVVYDGNFSDGCFNGDGTMTYPDVQGATKIEYVGEWMNDEEHGTGIMRYTDGHVYQGLWKNGIEHPLFVNGVLADNDEYNTAKRNWAFKRFPVAYELNPDDTVYDFFSLEETNILNELKNTESRSFIVKMGTTYCTTPIDNIIVQMNDKNNIKYECPKVNSMAGIITAEAYFSLKSIGCLSGGVVPLFDLWSAIQRKHTTAYKLIDTERVLLSTASHHSTYGYGLYESSSHCQAGQGERVYGLEILGRTKASDRPRDEAASTKKRERSRSPH